MKKQRYLVVSDSDVSSNLIVNIADLTTSEADRLKLMSDVKRVIPFGVVCCLEIAEYSDFLPTRTNVSVNEYGQMVDLIAGQIIDEE